MKKPARILSFALLFVAAYACGSGESLFSEGEVDTGADGGSDGTGGRTQGAGGDGATTTAVTTVTVGPGGRGPGGEGPGGHGTGGDGSGGDLPRLECVLSDFCSQPDEVACTCAGCNNDGMCTQNEDCVCPDCQNIPECQGCAQGAPSGLCHPYYEGCTCEDCFGHPACN